ncbi:hypothetical protein PAPHI01_0917 [Pancytospora philotis]|nr:hypothetical protein PAPHI01_0917 [Pancytospora philotis]
MKFVIDRAIQKHQTAEDVAEIVADILAVKNVIEVLECDLVTFCPAAFVKLCGAIKQLEKLRHFTFRSVLDTLTKEEMEENLRLLSAALPHTLEVFEFPDNALSCNFPDELGEFLRACPLKELDLHNCGLGERGLVRLTGYLAGVEDKSRLVRLNVSKNRINKLHKEFDELLSGFPNLAEFKIRNNTIESASMARFLGSLQNKQLRVLDLSDNFLCDDAVAALGELFLRLDLSQLLLRDIKMDDAEFTEFLETARTKRLDKLPGDFSASKPRLVLDISLNDFGQDVVPALLGLAEVFAFQELQLADNYFEDIHALKLLVEEDGGVVVEGDLMEDAWNQLSDVEQSIADKLKNL